MIDDFYQAALSAMRHQLDAAGTPYTVDEGELLVDSHRIGLSIGFEGFASQGGHTLAPLDIQIHLDGDDGDRFRVGTLGVGATPAAAVQDAIAEWHLLAVAPLFAALGSPVENRRAPARAQQLADWDLFPGRVGIRGKVPADLRTGSAFYGTLIDQLREVVREWPLPERFTLRSMYVMATCGPTSREIQAAVDGLLDTSLVARFEGLPWPATDETYLYKQLFVLRRDGLR